MENVKLTFVNVGYGEAMVLECPAPECPGGVFVMVIDGGSAEAEEYADRSSGRLTLEEYLRKRGVSHIDCMVCTHIHEDHICGLLGVAALHPPAELWQTLPESFYKTAMHRLDAAQAENASQNKFMRALNDYQTLCALVERTGGKIRCLGAGDSGELCPDVQFHVLAPLPDKADKLECWCRDLFREEDPKAFLQKLASLDGRMNNYSMILRLEHGGVRALLPGDTNCAGYAGIPQDQLKADLFKVGHHGQADGADAALLDLVRPKAVVCCASSDRRYNSAHPDTLRMIAERGSRLFFSDCPEVPTPVERAVPHQALEFTIDAQGEAAAKYVEIV